MDRCLVAHLLRWLLLLAAAAGLSASAQTAPRPVGAPAMTAATSATQWVAVRGQAADLAITPGGDVYALDPDGRLWRLAAQNIQDGTAENWLTQPGRFQRLRATHDGGLWAIDPADVLYQLRGSVWRPLVERIKDVAASPDGQTLVLTAKGELFDLYAGKPFEPLPPASGSASERLVADAHGLPWLQRLDRSVVRFDGTAWQAVASVADNLATLTAGNDGTILGIGLDGQVLRYMPQGNIWRPYITDGRVIPPLRHLVMHPSGMPWGIARSGELLAERAVGAQQKTAPSTPAAFTKLLTWTSVGGPSKKVSVGSDGTTYSLAPDGSVWRRKRGNEWIRVPAQAEAIAAGIGGQAWGLNAKGGMVQFDKGFIFDIPGIARLITAGPKNDLWAVFADKTLQQWNSPAKQWEGVMLLPEVPRAISIGTRGEPWIIDAEGMVKTYAENRWRPVPGITALSIDVGPEGTVYAASDAEGIYWLDAREMRWKPASGKAVQVAVGPGGAPWAITAQNELLASGRFIDADNAREAVAQNAAKKAAGQKTPSSTTTASTTPVVTTTASVAAASAFTSGSSLSGTPVMGVTTTSTPTADSSASSAFTTTATTPENTKPAVVFAGPAPATVKPLGYQTLFGETRFKDLGIGANGAVYAASVDGALMCFNNAANRFIIASSGTADRVTVAADGMPWILDSGGRISRFDKDRGAWRVVPSFSGVDVSIGPDGQLWAAGAGGSVFRYNASADSFEAEPVVSSDVSFKARRVAGANARIHWLISEQNQLIRCEKGDCRVVLTGALDAAVAPDNTVFVLDLFGNVQSYNQSKKTFEKQNGLGRAIAVGPGGLPWLVNSFGNIELAGIFNAASRTINTADCAGKFASAPAPAPVPSTVNLIAAADTASVFPGGSLDLLVNDSYNGRAPTINDVTVGLDTTSSFLTLSGGAVLVSSTATPGSILAGAYRICARNVVASCTSAAFSITVAGATTAPSGVSATRGNSMATVSFTAPTNTNNGAILGYTAIASPGGRTGNGGSSPLTVYGLTNGVAYTFTVKASYTNGTVRESDASAMVIPAAEITVPDSPVIGAAAAGNAQATVGFSAPASTGGSAITAYTVTSSPGGLTATGAASPLTVTGLTNGTAYIFTVTARNAIGTGLSSLASNSVTPTPNATVPGAPTSVTAGAGNTQATVSFSAPASNGGSAITGYTVTSSPGALSVTGAASPLTVTGLANATAYTFAVTARNVIGTSLPSAASNRVTPVGAPSTVNLVAAAYTASVFPGGSLDLLVNDSYNGRTPTLNDVTVGLDTTSSFLTLSGGTVLVSSTATPGSILAGAYRICARNVVASCTSATFSITVAGTTTAPSGVSATRGNSMATVSFTAPTSTSNGAILGYAAIASPGGRTGNGGSSPLAVDGLTNGVAYTFTVRANYANGIVKESGASVMVTPTAEITVPDSPVIGTAAAGNAEATVSFNAPINTGGSVITGYTVTSSPGGLTATGAASPLTVTGLTNGTAYTFTVTARNAIGTGLSSLASNSVTPTTIATVPGAPTIGTAFADNTLARVGFSAPINTGGSAITGYTATSSPGGLTATGAASPLTVTGLANGTAYTFTVTARNVIGTSLPSAASNSVTPAVIAVVAGAPTGVTASAGNGQATVSFSAPANTGGSAITAYTVTSSPGGSTATEAINQQNPSITPLTVTGLTPGTAYTFTVTATNATGTSLPSAASNSVTPTAAIPGAPTIGTASAGNAKATVSFSAPASNGGSAITAYTVTSSPGGLTATGVASPLIVNGLANGTAYTFTVTATNAVGTSLPSAASNGALPFGAPDAPTIGTASAGNVQATVSFSAPANTGGSAITAYTVTSSPGGLTATGIINSQNPAPTPLTVTGLTGGTVYTFTVTATNATGTSLPSAASNSVTPTAVTVPGTPTSVTASAGNAQATVSFSAPASNGGSAITGYTVTSSPGGLTATGASSPLTVTGLSNGTAYTFTVTATHAVGSSAASAASNSVTPTSGIPGAPTTVTASAGNAQPEVQHFCR